MLEETLKRSVEVREEKIASLESRLNESVSRNQELRNQLLQVCLYSFVTLFFTFEFNTFFTV